MSQRPTKRQPSKRQHVQSDDGWTVVSSGRSAKTHSSTSASPAHIQPANARPTRTVTGLTEEKLLSELTAMEQKWKTTSCAKNVSRMLSLRDWTVKEAVCIGVGSFSIDWEHRFRSLWQLVLFRAVVGILQHDPSTTTLAIYAQEPAFTPLDISFLSRLGITTLASSIESHIKPNSFVFAPFVDWNLLLPVFLKGRDPELYIGNEILGSYGTYANTKEKRDVLEECNGLGRKFAEGRERRKVPAFEEHGNALEGLMIYWKEDEDD